MPSCILVASDKNGDEDPPAFAGPVVARFDISIVCARRALAAARRSLDILKTRRVIQVELVPQETAKQNHEHHSNYTKLA